MILIFKPQENNTVQLGFDTCQTVNGKHKLEMCAWRHSTGLAVEYANPLRGSNTCIPRAGKATVLFGILISNFFFF